MARYPDSTELHLLKGTKSRAKTEQKGLEATCELWSPPKFLSAQGKAEWKRLGGALIQMGMLTEIDKGLFEMMISSFQEYLKMREIVKREGPTVPDKKGSLKMHPAVRLMNQAFSNYFEIAQKFGMSPLARKRMGFVVNTPSRDDDPVTRFRRRWDPDK